MKKLTTYRYDAKKTYDIRNCAKLYLEFETEIRKIQFKMIINF